MPRKDSETNAFSCDQIYNIIYIYITIRNVFAKYKDTPLVVLRVMKLLNRWLTCGRYDNRGRPRVGSKYICITKVF